MNNTYRPGGRPPVGINTPMAPTTTPSNRLDQMRASEQAKSAAIKGRSYAGNPADAPTVRAPLMPPPTSGAQRTSGADPGLQAAMRELALKQAAEGGERPAPATKLPSAGEAGIGELYPPDRTMPLPRTGSRDTLPMPPPTAGVDGKFNLGGGPSLTPPPAAGVDRKFNLGGGPSLTPPPAARRAGVGPEPAMSTVFRKGGNVKAYAKGGKVSSASSRGDGIATKGKTRGRMC